MIFKPSCLNDSKYKKDLQVRGIDLFIYLLISNAEYLKKKKLH